MLSNFRIPAWIWGLALIINAVLLVFNFERGNDSFLSLNILCATACIVGLLINRPK